jgi:SAM-dependent methyltransferase
MSPSDSGRPDAPRGEDDVEDGLGRIRARHFDARYQADPDPWGLERRWYERRKRAITLASLGRERYDRAFEPGCALGLLTELLAERCAHVVAADLSPTTVAAARRRLDGRANVEVLQLAVPDEWPDGTFDLVVLSEIGYYLRPGTLARLRDRAVQSLRKGGELLAVHWRGESRDHLLHGDEVHDVIGGTDQLHLRLRHQEDRFILEAFNRAEGD